MLTGRATLYCAGTNHGELYRKDQAYYSGNLKNTRGWNERECQICGRRDVKGLSSHHVFGISNDPTGEVLTLLCAGCHQVVTLLGNRNLTEKSWERLIMYAWMRKRGRLKPAEPHVTVTIKEI